MTEQTMLRYNEGKPRWGLLPLIGAELMVRLNLPMTFMEDIVATYSMGAIKYSDNNWRNGGSWLKVIDSAQRHVQKIMKGEMEDEESQIDHRGHVGWNILTLLTFDRDVLGVNDIWNGIEVAYPTLEGTDLIGHVFVLIAYFAETGDIDALEEALEKLGDTYNDA